MLFWAMVVALVARVAVLLYAATYPLVNEVGMQVSPLYMQQGIDIDFYLSSKASYERLVDSLVDSYNRLLAVEEKSRFYLPGPVLPLLLELVDYREGNTLPLAICFLLISCVLVCGWLVWLHRLGVGWIWLFLFALVPNPIWYTVNISTDLLFAGLFAGFFLPITVGCRGSIAGLSL